MSIVYPPLSLRDISHPLSIASQMLVGQRTRGESACVCMSLFTKASLVLTIWNKWVGLRIYSPPLRGRCPIGQRGVHVSPPKTRNFT